MICTRLPVNDASSLLVEFGRWIKALHSLFISGLPCPRWEKWKAETLAFFPSSKTARRNFPVFHVCSDFFFSSLAHTTSFSHSNEFDVSPVGQDDISLADMYRWKVSAYAPCSSTCTSGRFGFRWLTTPGPFGLLRERILVFFT